MTIVFLVKRRHLLVQDLYRPDGIYWYKWGINWRGYAGYIGGIIPNLPGFIGAMGYEVPIGATRVYSFAWILGFLVGGGIYYVCNLVFPCKWIIEERHKEVRYDMEEKPGVINNSVDGERRPSVACSEGQWSLHNSEAKAQQNE
jgi:NCS1 family nucleobase:cation symporter-1